MSSMPIGNGNGFDNGNGKITLAIINQKLDRLSEDLREIKTDLRQVDSCTDDLEIDHARLKTKVENLEGRVNSWSALNSIGAAVALVMGLFGLGEP